MKIILCGCAGISAVQAVACMSTLAASVVVQEEEEDDVMDKMNEAMEMATFSIRRYTEIAETFVMRNGELEKQNYKLKNKYYEQKSITSTRCQTKVSVGRRGRGEKPKVRNSIRTLAGKR